MKLVNGILSMHKKILSENGITSAEALAMSNFKDISGMEGIGEAILKKLI